VKNLLFCYFCWVKNIILNGFKPLPEARQYSKLSKKYLFAIFGFLNLWEFEFEVAVLKEINKGFP
jgi:hypothetical protein